MLKKYIQLFKERIQKAELADKMAKEATEELIPLKEEISIHNFNLSKEQLDLLNKKEILSFQRAKAGIEEVPRFMSKLLLQEAVLKETEYRKKLKEWLHQLLLLLLVVYKMENKPCFLRFTLWDLENTIYQPSGLS